MVEFRLRVGFLNFNPLYVGGLHMAALRDITGSPAMSPWRLGGDYDRPIARRIIEEAGIPRGAFAAGKRRSANFTFRSPADMSPAGRADFQAYRRAMPRPRLLRRLCQRSLVRLRAAGEEAAASLKSVWPGTDRAYEAHFPIPWWYRRYTKMAYAGHWGQARIRERYAEAVAARSREAAGATAPATEPHVRRA